MIHAAAFAYELVVFIKDSDGPVDLGGLAIYGKVAILQFSGHAQRGFQQFDVLVESAEQGFHPAGDLYSASHGRFGRQHCSGGLQAEPVLSQCSQPMGSTPPDSERNQC